MLLAGYIVKAGIWSPDDASKYVAAGAMALITLGWSIWQKYGMRSKLVTALASNGPMSEDTASRLSKAPDAPSVTSPKNETPK
jgi:hypothetical protein